MADILTTEVSTQEEGISIDDESHLQIPVVSTADSESIDAQSADNESSLIQSILSDDDIEIEENDDENFSISNKDSKKYIISIEESYSNYYTNEKKTSPILTKFERAKLLGIRAEMISAGNSPLVIVPKGVDNAYEIALLELTEKKIPLIIRRYMPDGSIEDWRVEELIIKHV